MMVATWKKSTWELQLADHLGILLLIAGTYTPFMLHACSPRVLAFVWLVGAVSFAAKASKSPLDVVQLPRAVLPGDGLGLHDDVDIGIGDDHALGHSSPRHRRLPVHGGPRALGLQRPRIPQRHLARLCIGGERGILLRRLPRARAAAGGASSW